jgi:hypothetical protein
LVVEAQDLTWKPGTDQVDVVALAVKRADYSARALLGNLGPDGLVSDHGILLERSVSEFQRRKDHNAPKSDIKRIWSESFARATHIPSLVVAISAQPR